MILTESARYFLLIIVLFRSRLCFAEARDGCYFKNVIPYTIDTRFSIVQKGMILKAIHDLERNTCLKWKDISTIVANSPLRLPRTLRFLYDQANHCSTSAKKSVVVFADRCFTRTFAVTHEIMHALGFSHEHQRRDRDCYVSVVENNAHPTQYAIKPPEFSPEWIEKFPYDKHSIVHYPSNVDMKDLIKSSKPLGNIGGEFTELDLWKIQYKFCGAPHYCEVYPEECEMINEFEKARNCRKPDY